MIGCSCGAKKIKILRNFKKQPICNKFKKKKDTKEYKHPIILTQCNQCGLLQLKKHVPYDKILPRVNWLKYKEPEKHLTHLAGVVSKLKNIPKKAVACGLTYKDDPLLKKLYKKSYKKNWRIDPVKDFNLKFSNIASEGIIPKITKKNILKLEKKYGKPDLLVARHILEHTNHTNYFLNLITSFVKPGGYIIFEVPDCSKQIKKLDYTMLWEEHNIYFNRFTLKNYFNYNYKNFKFCKLLEYKNNHENILIAIVQNIKNKSKRKKLLIKSNLKSAKNYADNFLKVKKKIQSNLQKYKKKYKKISLLGAGHNAIMFVNLMKIEKFLNFIVDDYKFKKNLFLPGTKLRIRNKQYMINQGKQICFSSINKKKINSNIKLLSIYPYQNNSVYKNI